MPRKKLSAKLRKEIKANYNRLKKSEFEGEALTYLNRVRGAAKARKAKKDLYVIVEDIKIDKRTELYDFVKAGADNKGQSVKEFIKDNPKAIQRLVEKYKSFDNTHLDKMEKQIDNLPDNKKIYNNGKEITKAKIHSYISMLRSAASESGLYDFIGNEVGKDLLGNLYFNIPTMEELLQINKDDLTEYLDEYYPNITYHKK